MCPEHRPARADACHEPPKGQPGTSQGLSAVDRAFVLPRNEEGWGVDPERERKSRQRGKRIKKHNGRVELKSWEKSRDII